MAVSPPTVMYLSLYIYSLVFKSLPFCVCLVYNSETWLNFSFVHSLSREFICLVDEIKLYAFCMKIKQPLFSIQHDTLHLHNTQTEIK